MVSTAGTAVLPNHKPKVEYAVASCVVVARGGVAVRTLVTLFPIAFAPGSRPGTRIDLSAGEEWDGRDEYGVVSPDGAYDVRVIHALLGRKTSGARGPWPVGDDLVLGLVATLSGGGPGGGGEGAPWAGYGHDGVKLFGIDDAATAVTVDDSPPQVLVDRPVDGAVLVTSPVSVAGRVIDASGAARVWVNGIPATLSGPRFEASVDLEPGLNGIDVLAEDGAGNRATATLTVRFAPDTTGPTIVMDYPLPGDVLFETPVDVAGRVTDPSGVMAVFVDGVGAEMVGGEFFGRARLEPGLNTIVVSAYDGLDNRSETTLEVTFWESSPPPAPGDAVIRGRVLEDATELPLAGVRVVCAAAGRSAVTGANGEYELSVPPADTPVPGPLEADGIRRLVVEYERSGYLRASRIAEVPEHPAPGFRRVVPPVYLAVEDAVATIVGPEGGFATNALGTVLVEVPAGALERPVELRVASYPTSRSLAVPVPDVLAFAYGLSLEPSGAEFAMPVRVWLANTLGLPPGTVVPAAWWKDGDWESEGSGVITGDGAWLYYETPHFSICHWSLPASGPEPPIEGPSPAGCGGTGCEDRCENAEAGGSAVSRKTGTLSEVIVVGPDGRENGDGFSPWPLRLVYSSDTVAPHGMVELTAWRTYDSVSRPRIGSPVEVQAPDRWEDWLFPADAEGFPAEMALRPSRLRYRYAPAGTWSTGLVPVTMRLGSLYQGGTYAGTGTALGAPHLRWLEVTRELWFRDERQSPFGAGWALAGHKRLERSGESWAVFDAGGATERFHGVGPGEVYTVAGNGRSIYLGSGRAARLAGVPHPSAVAFDGDGRLFVAHELAAGDPALSYVDGGGLLQTVLPPRGWPEGVPATQRLTRGVVALSWSAVHGALLAATGPTVVRVACSHDPTGPGGRSCAWAPFAGGGVAAAADGALATDVRFGADVTGVWGDPATGEAYLSTADGAVWRVDGPGRLWRVAGTPGVSEYGGDGGPARDATLCRPSAVTGDALGHIFVADESCPSVRRVDPTGNITTVVGNGVSGWTSDGHLAAGNPTYPPISLVVSPAGELHFGMRGSVAGRALDLVRKVGPAGELVTVVGRPEPHLTVAVWPDGMGATRVLARHVRGLAFDGRAILHYAEDEAHAVRLVGADGLIVPEDGGLATLRPYTVGDLEFVALEHPGRDRSYFVVDAGGARLVKTVSAAEAAIGWEYRFDYDSTGRLARVLDAVGRPATFEYDGAGKLSAIVDFSGQRRTFQIDSAGDLVETQLEGHPGTSRTFTYENHLLRGQTEGPRTAVYTYGADGMATRVERNGARWRELTASDAARVLNDRPWSPGQPPLSTADTWISDLPLGGFPATATVTDDRGVTREYAFWRETASSAWRSSAMAADPLTGSASFDATVRGDETNVAGGADPLRTDYFPYAGAGGGPAIARCHDAFGRVVEETTDHGVTTTTEYDAACDRPLRRETPYAFERRIETWTYDDHCRPVSHLVEIDPADGPPTTVSQTTYVYDPVTGLMEEEWDELGWKARYDYDGRLRLQTVERRDGSIRTLQYDAADRVTRETETGWDGRARWTERSYDELGRLRFVIGPRGQTEYRYDDAGGGGCCGSLAPGPRFVIDPDLNTTEYRYDDLGRVEWVIDEATSTRTKYRYDGLGTLVAAAELRDAAGDLVRETRYAYDWNGRLQAVVQPPANPGDTAGTTTYGYLHPDLDRDYRADAAVTSVADAEGRSSRYRWGTYGTNYRQVVDATLPDSGTDAYQYDGLGRLELQNRANGARWSWSYDMAGRVRGTTYDLNGGWSRPRWYVRFWYDARGNLETVGEYDGGPTTPLPPPRARVDFGYDDEHRLTSERRWQGDRLYPTTYEYDSLGNVEATVYPSGLRVWYLRQDPDPDRVTSVIAAAPSPVTLADAISYSAAGLLTGYRTGPGMEYGLRRGPRGRIERVTFGVMGDPTPEVLDLEYTYDDVSGNILGITDVVDPDRTAGYAWDALDRLVGADGWWGSLDWTYDKTGNRLSETRDGTASTYIYEPGTSRL
ncbi:MAG: hypothetical protein GYA57_00325, partial [Myxococcales bacterium]|nr:hypothetical protein [Myxococcales bacterium]